MSFLESIRSASPNRQLLYAGLATALVSLLLVAGYFVFLHRPYATLYSNLRTTDAATIVAELDKKKIPYRLDDGGARILVPTDVVDSTRLGFANEDLPIKGMVGFELFNKSDMGLTEFAQRINYQRALQGELARTIMTMGPVNSARVHLMLAEPTIFKDDRRPSKASVTVVARLGKSLGGDTVLGIQRVVAAAVPDLDASDVVVIDGDGRTLSSASSPAAVVDPPPSQERQAVEQYYAARLRRALAGVLPSQSDIQVAVRTDPSPTSIDGAGAALDSWTPGHRTFPLIVTVSFPAPPSPEAQSAVRRIASQAIELDSTKGDALNLAASGAIANDPAAPSSPGAVVVARADRDSPALLAQPAQAAIPKAWLVDILLAALVALGVVALWLQLRRGAPRRLTDERRSAIVQRLQTLLEEGEANAVPPL